MSKQLRVDVWIENSKTRIIVRQMHKFPKELSPYELLNFLCRYNGYEHSITPESVIRFSSGTLFDERKYFIPVYRNVHYKRGNKECTRTVKHNMIFIPTYEDND